MFALALLVHILAAASGPPTANPDGRGSPPAAVAAGSAASDGTGSASDPLAARPSLAIPPAPRGALAPRAGGPFGGEELAMAGVGALVGDALVLGAGYGALQLFARGAIEPTAGNFRRAAFVMTGAGLVVPPLLAVMGARLVNGQGRSFWRGLLLATAGHALALAVGYWASPQLWAFLPAQLAAVGAGTSLGLHWGSRRRDLGRRGGDAPDVTPAGPPLAWSLAACPVAG